MNFEKVFVRLSKTASYYAGHPAAFGAAATLVIGWALSGPLFGFGETWQLVINTTTTIITFLMVFLIQSSQNRDTAALQLKLDELIRVTEGAHNILLDLEELNEHELENIRKRYEEIADEARNNITHGKPDTGVANIDIDRINPK